MEYRRRRRIACKLPRGNSVFPAAVVALTFLSVVYVFGVSKLGGFLAETLIAPVFRVSAEKADAGETGSAGAQTPLPDAQAAGAQTHTAPAETETLALPAFALHALQMGVFSSEENAKQQSALLREMGAGGYVYEEGGRFRVLAAGYADAESLKKVRAQLTAEGLESASHSVSVPAGEWRVTAPAASLAAYRAAVTGLCDLSASLTALALSFDKEEQSVPEGLRALALLQSELTLQRDAYAAAVGTADAQGEGIAACFSLASAELALLSEMDESGRVEFTAALKYAQLHLATELAALLTALAD